MHKRTKFAFGLIAFMGIALGVASFLVGMGYVALLPKLIWFDIGIVSAFVGIGSGVFASSSSLTGYVRRRRAEKIQAKSIAKMANVSTKERCAVKQKINTLKLSNKLTKSMVYSAKNNQSGMIGQRNVISQTQSQTKLANKVSAYNARREFFNASTKKSSVKQSKVFDKKSIKAKTKLNKEIAKQPPISRRYSWTSVVTDPFNGQKYEDHRNEIMCSSSETLNEFKKYINADKERYNKENYKDFGYVTTLRFSTNETLKDTCVKSNVEDKMELYELMLLKEVKREIASKGTDGIFPIQLEKSHYVSHKNSKATHSYIIDENELDYRINALTKYINNDENVKVYGKNYINRNYSYDEVSKDNSSDYDMNL